MLVMGKNWATGSNGYWNYKVIGTSVTGSKVSKYAKKKKLFFSSAVSASLNLPNSSSLIPAEVSTDDYH